MVIGCDNRGQFQMSYSMLFSIFLIAVFVFVAIFAIGVFLNLGGLIETGTFIRDLQDDVNIVWSGAGADIPVNYTIRGGELTHICFFDSSSSVSGDFSGIGNELKRNIPSFVHNLYFFPMKTTDIYSVEIKHIDMEAFSDNPYCIPRVEEQFRLNIKMNLRDTLVRIE